MNLLCPQIKQNLVDNMSSPIWQFFLKNFKFSNKSRSEHNRPNEIFLLGFRLPILHHSFLSCFFSNRIWMFDWGRWEMQCCQISTFLLFLLKHENYLQKNFKYLSHFLRNLQFNGRPLDKILFTKQSLYTLLFKSEKKNPGSYRTNLNTRHFFPP